MADINEIISQEAITGIESTNKALKSTNDLVEMLIKNLKDAQKVDSTLSGIGKSGASTADATKAIKEQEAAMSALDKQRQKGLEQMAKQEAKEREMAEALGKEAKSVADLQKQNKALIDQRNKLDTSTKAGAKAIGEINKQLDANNKKIKENSSNLEQQKINIGNYISAWGPFQGVANMMTRAIGIMKIAFISLKAAIISTGIGALVVAVASLYTYFTRTGEGADKFARFMNQVRAVIDVLMDRVAGLGKGLAQIFTGQFAAGAATMKAAFKGIGDEIEREVKLAGELADSLDAIEDTVRASKTVLAQNAIQREKLLGIARSEEYSAKERYDAVLAAMGLAKQNFAIEQNNARMQIKNLEDQAALRELNDDELDKLTDARVELMNKEAAAQSEINSLLKLRNTLSAKAAEEEAIIASRTLEISTMIALEAEQVKTDAHLEGLALRKQADIDFEADEDERLAIRREKIIAENEWKIQAAAMVGEAMNAISSTYLAMQMAATEKQKAYEIQMAGDNAAKKQQIEEKYDKKFREIKRKQAVVEKSMATFRAAINFAQAILAALAGGPPPFNIILAAITAALAGIQMVAIAATPIPQFARGTSSARRGLAWVGERGRELMIGKDGNLMMTPGTATLMNLRGGERILSNPQTELLMRAARGADDHYSRRMLDQMHADNLKLIDTVKNKPVIQIDRQGNRITERSGDYFRTYLNRRIK